MNGYDTDIVEWSERQGALLRRLALGETVEDQIDWSNIIDEVATAGRFERAALRSRIAVVLEFLEYLMKLEASPSVDPRNGWEVSVVRARRGTAILIVSRLVADLKPGVCDAPLRGYGA